MILTIANIAEVNRTPFDLPEAESEIIAGYHTEYSGMRFGLFFLAEYLSVFGVSCLGTVLFLGGGTPAVHRRSRATSARRRRWRRIVLVNLILVSASSWPRWPAYVFLMFWIRATLPRLRVDRLMNFAWKYLVPLSIVNILIAAVWYECVIRPARAELPARLGGSPCRCVAGLGRSRSSRSTGRRRSGSTRRRPSAPASGLRVAVRPAVERSSRGRSVDPRSRDRRHRQSTLGSEPHPVIRSCSG